MARKETFAAVHDDAGVGFHVEDTGSHYRLRFIQFDRSPVSVEITVSKRDAVGGIKALLEKFRRSEAELLWLVGDISQKPADKKQVRRRSAALGAKLKNLSCLQG